MADYYYPEEKKELIDRVDRINSLIEQRITSLHRKGLDLIPEPEFDYESLGHGEIDSESIFDTVRKHMFEKDQRLLYYANQDYIFSRLYYHLEVSSEKLNSLSSACEQTAL